jgi:hypothetical protein
MATEVMAKEHAQDGKKKAEEKTAKINVFFHSRIPSSGAGHLSGGDPAIPSILGKSSYKMTLLFVTQSLARSGQSLAGRSCRSP